MAVGTTTAIVASILGSAVIGAGSAAYSADQQSKAADEDRKRREAEAAAQKAEADRISHETRPEEEALAETKFGTQDPNTIGSAQEFLVPKTSALGGSDTGRSGLGFVV